MATIRKTSTKPAAKPAAARVNPLSAVDSTRQSAETVVNISSKAVKDLQSSISSEAQKTQEKIYAMGRESAQTISRSADMATKAMNDTAAICKDNVEVLMECGNISANVAKSLSEELSEIVNQSLTDCMEICQEALACRTMNDVVELNNKIVRSYFDNCFEQTSRISNMLFECASEICDPINERVSSASDQISKMLAR